MQRDKILNAADACVSVDRATVYGDAETNFTQIAALWSAYLGVTLDKVDAAAMLALFKIARTQANKAHIDSWIDGCGYLALAGEMAGKE
jgi:hypothetical protein